MSHSNSINNNNGGQQQQRSLPPIPQYLTAEAVAALPPPGLTGPSSICFSPTLNRNNNDENNDGNCYLAFLATTAPSSFSSSGGTSSVSSRRFHYPRHHTTPTTRTTNPQHHSTTATAATTTTTTTGERQLCAIHMNNVENQIATITGGGPMTQGQIQQYVFPLLKLPPKHSSVQQTSSGGILTGGGIPSSSSTNTTTAKPEVSLEERLRRERQRLHASGGVTQFSWTYTAKNMLRILVPLRGNIYIQNDVGALPTSENLQLIYDKNINYSNTAAVEKKSGAVVGRDKSAIDPQLSPDGSMVAFVVAGDIYVVNAEPTTWTQSNQNNANHKPVQITFGASTGSGSSSTTTTSGDAGENEDKCITHGLADFVAQEEMDRYRGYWWDPQSNGILFTRVDETCVPPYRIIHQGRDGGVGSSSTTSKSATSAEEATYEDHRYPFAGKANPEITLGYVKIDRASILGTSGNGTLTTEDMSVDGGSSSSCQQQKPQKASKDKSLTQQQQQPRGVVGSGEDNMQVLNYYLDGDDQPMDESTVDTDGTAAATGAHLDGILDDNGDKTTANNIHTRAAQKNWSNVKWLNPPPQAKEYLVRINWLPDGTVCAQWQNRLQSTLVLARIDIDEGTTRTLHVETSDLWINLHNMMRPLSKPIHPDDCSHSSSSRGSTTDQTQSQVHHQLPNPLPEGSFSFLFASERTGYSHLYLYTYVPGYNEGRAILIRQVSGGDWMVENIAGVDMKKDVVYVTGTYDSPLERHLYALPLTNRASQRDATRDDSTRDTSSLGSGGKDDSMHDGPPSSGGGGGGGVRRGFKQVISAFGGGSKPRRSNNSMSSSSSAQGDDSATHDPIRLTSETGMHNIVMDDDCKYFVDTTSDIGQPTSVKVYKLPERYPFPVSSTNVSPPSGKMKKVPRKTSDYNQENSNRSIPEQRPPQAGLFFALFDSSRPSSMPNPFSNDNSVTTDIDWLSKLPAPELISYPTSDGTETLHAAVYRPDPQVFGPGPYPLICAVYGGPHVQRVNRSWAQCADMRAQRLRSFGFAVVKCDNRGSSRRGLAFESAVRNRLGRLEVLDQVTTVRQLVTRGIADPNRVGIYGWSYGGYLAAMCLCRAPDVFHVGVSGAPVTSWDGYDTHYTERYMGLPADNPSGYREAAIFDHVPNMRGKLMIVHGLIDENVHFRHTARLINRFIASGKDYDLLIFPEERHSPRRLRDRIYMEQRISDYFLRNLCGNDPMRGIGGGVTGASSPSPAGQGGGNGPSSSSSGMRPMVGHL